MGVWIETVYCKLLPVIAVVTPCVGVWIETDNQSQTISYNSVTPCVGVWIETLLFFLLLIYPKSHPAWVCGLKHVLLEYITIQF